MDRESKIGHGNQLQSQCSGWGWGHLRELALFLLERLVDRLQLTLEKDVLEAALLLCTS